VTGASRHRRIGAIRLLFVVVAAYLVVLAVLASLTLGVVRSLAPFFVALVLINLLAVRLPRGDVIVIDGAITVGALLLFGRDAAMISLAVGGLIGSVWLRGEAGTRIQQLVDVSRRALALWCAAALAGVLSVVRSDIGRPENLVMAMAIGLLYMAIDLGTYAALESTGKEMGFIGAVKSVSRPVLFLYIGQVGLGVSLAIVYTGMGILSVAVIGVLATILLNAFNMYLRTRLMYQQTIYALAHATALHRADACLEPRLVAEISVAVGRRLGMRGASLERLNYAAVLCDVGHLGLPEGESDGSHAERGAVLVEAVPFLADTADIIRLHHAMPSEISTVSAEVRTAAGIVHLCSDFIRAVTSLGGNPSVEQQLEVLRDLQDTHQHAYSLEATNALGRELQEPSTSVLAEWGRSQSVAG